MPAQAMSSGSRDDGQKRDLGEPVIRLGRGGRCGDLREEAGGQRLLEARGAPAQPLVHGDDAVVGHHPEGGAFVRQ